MTLLFEIADLRKELSSFRELARTFLAQGSDEVLRALDANLASVATVHTADRAYPWSIARDRPLRSTTSRGAYMPDGRGSLDVHAEMCFVWDVEPIRPRGDTRPAKQIRLDGRASTEIRLVKGDPFVGVEELAVWRMEIADSQAPGAFFHVQVLGRDEDDLFPKALDIPRLPGFLATPFASMEFVLGELFQDEWRRHALQDSGPERTWRAVQLHRHQRHLAWATRAVSEGSGSPWVRWKVAKPDQDLFMPR